MGSGHINAAPERNRRGSTLGRIRPLRKCAAQAIPGAARRRRAAPSGNGEHGEAGGKFKPIRQPPARRSPKETKAVLEAARRGGRKIQAHPPAAISSISEKKLALTTEGRSQRGEAGEKFNPSGQPPTSGEGDERMFLDLFGAENE